MVKASRKKLVVMSVAVLVAAAVITFAAQPIRDAVCFPFLSPTERKVVGEWQAQLIGGLNVTTIHADHTWTSVGGSCFGDDMRPIVGRWRVDGSDVVLSFDSRQFGDWPAPGPRRYSIQQLIDRDRETRLALRSPQK